MWHVIHARHRMLAALMASASLNCIAWRINHEREGGRREDELTAKQKACASSVRIEDLRTNVKEGSTRPTIRLIRWFEDHAIPLCLYLSCAAVNHSWRELKATGEEL